MIGSDLHNCRIVLESDSAIAVFVPVRDFRFGYTSTFTYDVHSERFQLKALREGSYPVRASYYVEGRLVDSREVKVTVLSAGYWMGVFGAIGGIVIVILLVVAVIKRGPRLIERRDEKIRKELDRKSKDDVGVLQVVNRYGGIISKTAMVFELGIPLEESQRVLDRFVQHGEARRLVVDGQYFYDFPGARINLSHLDARAIELLMHHSGRLSRVELVVLLGKSASVSLEAVEESLKRLERKAILIHEISTDEYKLKGMTV